MPKDTEWIQIPLKIIFRIFKLSILNISVSKILHETIKELMREPLLSDFYLGGGTNLAIKYNHRVSVDIDLFSSRVVGLNKMKEIVKILQEKYADSNINLDLQNRESENLSFIRCEMSHKGEEIKVDIIQNIKMLLPQKLQMMAYA